MKLTTRGWVVVTLFLCTVGFGIGILTAPYSIDYDNLRVVKTLP